MINKKSQVSKESVKIDKSNKVIKKRQLNMGKETQAPEVIDSQEAGPSNARRNEGLTFYPSDSDDSFVDDDDAACVICNLKTPPAIEKQIRVERRVVILKWGKCDSCHGWVHLKYCFPIEEIERGSSFKCIKC